MLNALDFVLDEGRRGELLGLLVVGGRRVALLLLVQGCILESPALEHHGSRRVAALATVSRAISNRTPNGTVLNRVLRLRSRDPLSLQLVLESSNDVMSLNSVHLALHVGLNEFLHANEATADADKHLVAALDLDVDSALPEFVNTL